MSDRQLDSISSNYRMSGLDLFSGIGGITVALSPWVRAVAYCEKDRHAQAVLLSRMAKGDLQSAPIWDDVQTLTGEMLPPVDIIYGGFPCQDISIAGNRVGLEGKRSGLFFEIVRLAEEIKPQYLFLENVAAIRTLGLSIVGKELASLGYDCRWDIVSAEEVGAPHLRRRWFLLAKLSDAASLQRQAIERDESKRVLSNLCDTDSDKLREQPGRKRRKKRKNSAKPFHSSWWSAEPDVGRVAHGIPHRVDRLRGLGNAVVPLQARTAFERLMGLETINKGELI